MLLFVLLGGEEGAAVEAESGDVVIMLRKFEMADRRVPAHSLEYFRRPARVVNVLSFNMNVAELKCRKGQKIILPPSREAEHIRQFCKCTTRVHP